MPITDRSWRLTEQGMHLIDEAITSHFSTAARAANGLRGDECAELARLLRVFRLQLE
ncbi:MAG: hypothetical protein ABI810_20935 [Sphingomonas bacterium]